MRNGVSTGTATLDDPDIPEAPVPVLPHRRGRRWLELFRTRNLILLAVVVVIGYLTLVPITYLVWGTFFNDTGFTLNAFKTAYTAVGLGSLAWNSALFTVGSTALSVAIGTALAYLTERTNVPFKRFIFASTLIPLVIPSILFTISWIFLASPRIGIINHLLEPVLGPGFLDIFTLPGMIFVQGVDGAPLVFLIMVAGFRSMDPSLEESALTSGASLPKVLRSVTLPLAKPALFGAVLIMAIRNLEAFEVPALLGMPNRIWVLTSRIWSALQYPPDYAEAGAYSVTLLVIASVGVYFQSRLTRRGGNFQTVTGKGFRPRALPLGRWRRLVGALVMVYFAIAIIAPAVVLLYMALQPYYSLPSLHSVTHLTLKNFSYVVHYPKSLTAFRNSFVLAAGAATIVMVLTAIASWLVIRTKIRGRGIVDVLAFLPIVIPGLVLGVALLFVYLRSPLPIYGTMLILLIAYTTKFLPYGMRFASSSTYQIGEELEESAQTSGATWWQTFRRINVPLLMPGLMAGFIYIVLTAVRELSASLLLYSPGNEVLSVLIWEQYSNGQFNELAALGIVMIGVLVVLVLLAQKLGAKVGVDSATVR
jgi:iron(III) transport system permease protein